MKTLSFHETEIGRSSDQLLIEIDSSRDEVSFQSGLNVVLAPNGYGKSTLLQTIGGVLTPLKGHFLLDRQIFSKEKDSFYMSEYLSFPKFIYPHEWIRSVTENDLGSDFESLSHALALETALTHYLGRMSQGERRKVAWLAAHCSNKPVILLDEPLDGLDLLAMEGIRSIIAKWKIQKRVIVVVVHQIGEILDIVDRVFYIHKKRLKNLPVDYPIRKFLLETYQA